MTLTVDPKQYIIGAAQVYNRAIGSTGPWTSMGATLDDAVARINATWFRPDNINLGQVRGPIMGLDVLQQIEAEAEFTLPTYAASRMSDILPGTLGTDRLTTDAGGTPLSTTLAAAAIPGQTNIKVVAVTNAVPGDFIRIDAPGNNAEFRQIDVVGTAGAGGTGISFRDPLLLVHINGQPVVETVGDGRTVIVSPVNRRLPDTEYKDWALVSSTGNKYAELRLLNGISKTDAVEMTFGDQVLAGTRVKVGGRYDGAALQNGSFQLIIPT